MTAAHPELTSGAARGNAEARAIEQGERSGEWRVVARAKDRETRSLMREPRGHVAPAVWTGAGCPGDAATIDALLDALGTGLRLLDALVDTPRS